MLWSLARAAPSLPAFRAATHFGVNVLGSEHRDLAVRFARGARQSLKQHRHSCRDLSVRFARGARDKFAGVDYTLGEYGVPLLGGAAAHFECRIVDRYYGGDHEIFLGHVERYHYVHKPTLLFCHGTYHRAHPLDDGGA